MDGGRPLETGCLLVTFPTMGKPAIKSGGKEAGLLRKCLALLCARLDRPNNTRV